MSIESKQFVASPTDIEALTREMLTARGAIEGGRATYLRALVATTQKELGASPRQRTRGRAKLPAEAIEAQVAALESVHERFYAAVLTACQEGLPGGEGRARELNRRSNFARTAKSMLRSWIRAGHDVTTLAAARVTKAALAVRAKRPRAASPTLLARRTEAAATRLTEAAEALARTDKAAAMAALEAAMTALAERLTKLGASPTRDVKQAAREHRPVTIQGATFWPTTPAERPRLRAAAQFPTGTTSHSPAPAPAAGAFLCSLCLVALAIWSSFVV